MASVIQNLYLKIPSSCSTLDYEAIQLDGL